MSTAGNRADRDGKHTLWTKNFTILTAGTVVSMLGNQLSGFAIGLLVLDYTKSTFLYALYLVMYNLPKVIVPALAGPYIDRYSRRKTIYTLDFVSFGIFMVFALAMYQNWFNYRFLLVSCILLGCIDSIYNVAYESFYPMLISEGNYSKAYSVSSTLETLTAVVIPVSALLYNLIGIGPLFLLDGISFLLAAVFETQIKAEESQVERGNMESANQFWQDFKEGGSYLKSERGLLAIAVFFLFSMFADGAFSTIALPYFKSIQDYGEYLYILVLAFMGLGRLAGGGIHYRYRVPKEKKFRIALLVYAVISVIGMVVLYVPVGQMYVLMFIMGLLGMTSYNIRISGTQNYVPNERKGRFNGIFNMMSTVGMLAGQLFSGILASFLPKRAVVVIFYVVSLAAVSVMVKNRKYVKKIYNVEA